MCTCQAIWMRLLSSPYHIWIDSLFAMSAMGKCSLLVSVSLRLRRLSVVQRCLLFADVNARWTSNEQPKVVGAGTKSCGAGTSLNKEYWNSKAASDSSCIFLERDLCLWLATNSCNRSQACQTDGFTTYTSFVTNSGIMLWIQHVMEVFYV